MTEPTPGLVADLARGGRRHHGHRRGRQDGPDAGAHGQARGAGQARHRRGALQQSAGPGLARGARRRVHRLRPARPRGGAQAAQRGRRRAQLRVHGRPQVRRGRQRVADLDDERRRADDGGRRLPRHAHRVLLHRLRVPLRAGGRPRRRRGRADHAAAWRLCQFLRRPRAHVRVRLARLRHAGAHGAAVLRHRHALRRAARRGRARCSKAGRWT